MRTNSASRSRKVVFSDKDRASGGEELKEGGTSKAKKPPKAALGVAREDAPKLTEIGITYEAKEKSDVAVEKGIPDALVPQI